MRIAALTPVLEIGGTHVTAALVHRHDDAWTLRRNSLVRLALDAHAPAEDILDAVAQAARLLGNAHNTQWGVALPGPFDYQRGIGRYEDVGKFDALNGVDVRAGLAQRLGELASGLTFLNDADAFGIGEHALRQRSRARLVCITLGTGIGSSFLVDGIPLKAGPGVPPDGSCHLIGFRGRALEETVSRRAIRQKYAEVRAGDHDQAHPPDVHEIAASSRHGDEAAERVLTSAFTALGEALAPYLYDFRAESLVIGGSMAGSWDIVSPAVRNGLLLARPSLRELPIIRSDEFEEACLVGTARWVDRQTPT